MGDTSIEWTDHSINPIRARLRDAAHAGVMKGGYGAGVGHFCEKISPGCALCYASTSQRRFGMPAFPGVQKVAPAAQDVGLATVAVNDRVEVFFDGSRLEEVLRRKKPTKYFWCDQTDLFGRWVPDDWIDRCFSVMALTPWHTHQVLTKRAERMAGYLTKARKRVPHRTGGGVSIHIVEDQITADAWPLPNVWIGVSVENQSAADERIPHLLKCPAAVRFLSVEPLIGKVDLSGHPYPLAMYAEPKGMKFYSQPGGELIGVSGGGLRKISSPPRIHWVIVGGESGPGARPMNPAWVRSLRDQCQSAGVAFFFKQWGAWTESERKLGKKAAGRLLDGREWNEMPEVARA